MAIVTGTTHQTLHTAAAWRTDVTSSLASLIRVRGVPHARLHGVAGAAHARMLAIGLNPNDGAAGKALQR
jgi:hypothetical protein